MNMDNYIVKNMISGKYLLYNYPQYFAQEIKPNINNHYGYMQFMVEMKKSFKFLKTIFKIRKRSL